MKKIFIGRKDKVDVYLTISDQLSSVSIGMKHYLLYPGKKIKIEKRFASLVKRAVKIFLQHENKCDVKELCNQEV